MVIKKSLAVDITPSAKRLTESLRDIGYDFVNAVSDLIDNAISAMASRVDIELNYEGPNSYVLIADDGLGMTTGLLHEALRFGSCRHYGDNDLGRFGLGLKTASLSQCRRVTVASRRSLCYARISARTLDIDRIAALDRWEITDPLDDRAQTRAEEWLRNSTGTVVVWENLDRIIGEDKSSGGWARRRLSQLSTRLVDHLGMVFHRFLETNGKRLTLTVNGEKVRPWNPFALDEEHLQILQEQWFEIPFKERREQVVLRRYVLPQRHLFSSPEQFERLSGPRKWNRQQGLYIYRSNRLIQAGGWAGIRTADEHTKFARAALDFPSSLDEMFRINVAKMRVLIPAQVRTMIERPINELCQRADSVYRRELPSPDRRLQEVGRAALPKAEEYMSLGSALMAAALDAGEASALARIMDHLVSVDPRAATLLGW